MRHVRAVAFIALWAGIGAACGLIWVRVIGAVGPRLLSLMEAVL
jgi:hypothetical protein